MERAESLDRAGCDIAAESLNRGHRLLIRVTGSSMVPAIWPGDTIEIIPAGEAPTSAGQVALYVRDGRLFAHRIVGVAEAAHVITRGDALAACDPPAARAEILGYVSVVVRDGRRIPMADGAPSRRARMLSFAIRNSNIARRLILGLRARRGGAYRTVNRCPA